MQTSCRPESLEVSAAQPKGTYAHAHTQAVLGGYSTLLVVCDSLWVVLLLALTLTRVQASALGEVSWGHFVVLDRWMP